MSDDGEMWRALRRERQERRQAREARDVPKLLALCDAGHLSAVRLDATGWRVRLPGASWTVDYWPRSGTVTLFGERRHVNNPRDLWRRMQQWHRERGDS